MRAIRNIFILLLCVSLLFSCTKKEADKKSVEMADVEEVEAEERISVSIYCYDVALMKGLTPLLEERFPDVDIQVITGVNDISFLTAVNEMGYLPDIMCMRKFSLNDAKYIRSNLMDLSRTEVAATFHSSILKQNRDEDGSIRWLPSCAEIDGIVASRKLFQEYGLDLPSNYEEFINAIEVFKENGKIPFITDFRYDYTCMEILQGLSISNLMTLEGVAWRQKYESEKEGEHVLLDEEVWMPVFEKFYDFISAAEIGEKDANLSYVNVNNEINSGNAVMCRNTISACASLASSTDLDTVMLPYYGETENDNWILTYPYYQVAVSKEVEDNPKKKQIVLEMLSIMLSKEGEEATVLGAPLLSYTMTNDVELSSSFDTILPEIERNHIYMRLASIEFFNISKTVVQDILKGKHTTPREAFDAFNNLLSQDNGIDSTVTYTSSVFEDNVMTEKGNMAESSTLNLIRDGLWLDGENKKYSYTEAEGYSKCDIAIAFSGLNATPVFKGDYTKALLGYVACPRKSMYSASLTGEEIDSLMRDLVDKRENGKNPIIHENMVPVASGFSFNIRDNGDGSFTYCGSDLEKDKTYNLLLVGNLGVLEENAFAGTPINGEIKAKIVSYSLLASSALPNIIARGFAFEEATPYLTWM